MGFVQQKFLGASISNFSASLGWGRQPSSLSCVLVEDDVQSDAFTPYRSSTGPLVGQPCYFNCTDDEANTWSFNGILQNWTYSRGEGGFVFNVTITDPRELLSGVMLIIDGYNGITWGVPNLYNIYGYLEALYGFGGSLTNDTGTPYWLIRDAFLALQTSTPISFRSHYYFVSLTNLPILPDDFRIPGESLSLLDFVETLCEAANYDYFVTLQSAANDTGGVHWITINTISRRTEADIGKITAFVNSVNANSSESGIELRNEPTSKFLTGGKMEQMYYVDYDYAGDTLGDHTYDSISSGVYSEIADGSIDNSDGSDDTIWPYWGRDAYTGNVIVGKYNPEAEYLYEIKDHMNIAQNTNYIPHQFTINLWPLGLEHVESKYKSMQYGLGGTKIGIPYETDTMEMRAVLAGQDSWETFLWTYNGKAGSIHNGKATALHLLGRNLENLKKILNNVKKPSTVGAGLAELQNYQLTSERDPRTNETPLEADKRKLYEFLKIYAEEYYGKKFMVRIPNVSVKKLYSGLTTDNDIVITSLEPSDSGFLDEILWPTGVSLGYLPSDMNKFTDESNKIVAYVKFNGVYRSWRDLRDIVNGEGKVKTGYVYNIENLNDEDFVLYNNTLFVKCSVDPQIVFLGTNYTNPRVVITLPSQVPKLYSGSESVGFISLFLKEQAISDAEFANMYKDILAKSVFSEMPPIFCLPDSAAVPLRSNVNFYGPWYTSTGSAGKTDFEQDPTLVPWNYGGFYQMNLVANAKISAFASQYQASETGSVTFPGVPTIPLGSVLIAGGPYVTDVSVNIGEGGVTTTYRMQTWTSQFGTLGKHNEERFKRLTLENQKRRREARALIKKRNPKAVRYSTEYRKDLPKRTAVKTPHTFICGQVKDITDSDKKFVHVGTVMPEDIDTTAYKDYNKKAGATLDTLFRPFSTNSSDTNFNGPHFVSPTDTGDKNVDDLNPFDGAHDFIATFHDQEMPETGLNQLTADPTGNDYRVIGFRNPLVLVGWGFDLSNKPVPNETPASPTNNFITDYKQRMDLWKAGPLDVRWDEGRGVWTFGRLYTSDIPDGTTVANNSTYEFTTTGDISGCDAITVTAKNITGVDLVGPLQVRIEYFKCYEYPLVSPYDWTTCVDGA